MLRGHLAVSISNEWDLAGDGDHDFVGNAPDLGAYELGGEMLHYGARQQ